MEGTILAAFLWFLGGCFFVGLGIYAFISKKEISFGFWANMGRLPVNDIRAYNRAIGKLWCVFGIVFAALGVPLLTGQNSAFLIISILGSMAEAIIAMAVYTTVIEKKYRKK